MKRRGEKMKQDEEETETKKRNKQERRRKEIRQMNKRGIRQEEEIGEEI